MQDDHFTFTRTQAQATCGNESAVIIVHSSPHTRPSAAWRNRRWTRCVLVCARVICGSATTAPEESSPTLRSLAAWDGTGSCGAGQSQKAAQVSRAEHCSHHQVRAQNHNQGRRQLAHHISYKQHTKARHTRMLRAVRCTHTDIDTDTDNTNTPHPQHNQTNLLSGCPLRRRLDVVKDVPTTHLCRR